MAVKKQISKTSSKSKSVASPMNEEMKWRAQSDARTLKDSLEIKNDSKRLAAAQQHINKEMAAMKEVSKMKSR